MFQGGGISPHKFRNVFIEMAEIHNHVSALGYREKNINNVALGKELQALFICLNRTYLRKKRKK